MTEELQQRALIRWLLQLLSQYFYYIKFFTKEKEKASRMFVEDKTEEAFHASFWTAQEHL